MPVQLSTNNLKQLREQNILNDQEIAYMEGDLLIAENVITKVRRIVDSSNILIEQNKKRLLNG